MKQETQFYSKTETLVDNDMVFNYMLDLRKRDIDPMKRASIIQGYLDKTKKSQRELARDLGIPHSTVQDWLLWTRIDEDEYSKMRSNGLNVTDIYRELRDGKNREKFTIVNKTKFQREVEQIQKFFRSYKSTRINQDEIDMLKQLRDTINIILMRSERDME